MVQSVLRQTEQYSARGKPTMTIEQIRNFTTRNFFQPFVNHLADGSEILVRKWQNLD